MKRLSSGRQSINASSMADIAFLLLVFFLVTATMAQEVGLPRKLPPPDPAEDSQPAPRHNVLELHANANDQLLIEMELKPVTAIHDELLVQLYNADNLSDLPGKDQVTKAICRDKIAQYTRDNNQIALAKWQKRLEAQQVLGDYEISKLIVSLQNDRGTSYAFYIAIQDQLAAAYSEAREALAQDRFFKPYDNLTKAQQAAVRTAIPMRISEAEPNKTL